MSRKHPANRKIKMFIEYVELDKIIKRQLNYGVDLASTYEGICQEVYEKTNEHPTEEMKNYIHFCLKEIN